MAKRKLSRASIRERQVTLPKSRAIATEMALKVRTHFINADGKPVDMNSSHGGSGRRIGSKIGQGRHPDDFAGIHVENCRRAALPWKLDDAFGKLVTDRISTLRSSGGRDRRQILPASD